MRFPFIWKKRNATPLCPTPEILLNLPFGKVSNRIFSHVGIWRKTACFATLNATIKGNPTHFKDLPPVSFQWAEKRTPAAGRLPVFCEHGWMPRDAYQISSKGCNQRHPVADLLRDSTAEPPIATEAELERLEQLKKWFPLPHSPQDLCDRPFFLFALQITTDLNLQRCGLDLASTANRKDGGEVLLGLLSAMISDCKPDARVLFLQHPADKTSFPTQKLLRPNHDYVSKERKLRFLDLALSPHCLGVLSINSNALNEAMLFLRPVFQMGDFLMNGFPNRLFPYSLAEFLDQPQRCQDLSAPFGYMAALMRNQYTLGDLADPTTLRNLILKETARTPLRE